MAKVEPKKELRKHRAIICIDCGKRVLTDAPNIKRCPKCRRKRIRIKNTPEQRICDHCFDDYITTRSWSRFCSARCRSAYNRQVYETNLLKTVKED